MCVYVYTHLNMSYNGCMIVEKNEYFAQDHRRIDCRIKYDKHPHSPIFGFMFEIPNFHLKIEEKDEIDVILTKNVWSNDKQIKRDLYLPKNGLNNENYPLVENYDMMLTCKCFHSSADRNDISKIIIDKYFGKYDNHGINNLISRENINKCLIEYCNLNKSTYPSLKISNFWLSAKGYLVWLGYNNIQELDKLNVHGDTLFLLLKKK